MPGGAGAVVVSIAGHLIRANCTRSHSDASFDTGRCSQSVSANMRLAACDGTHSWFGAWGATTPPPPASTPARPSPARRPDRATLARPPPCASSPASTPSPLPLDVRAGGSSAPALLIRGSVDAGRLPDASPSSPGVSPGGNGCRSLALDQIHDSLIPKDLSAVCRLMRQVSGGGKSVGRGGRR